MPENRHMDLPGEGEVRRAALLHRQRAAVGEQLDPLGAGGFTENVRDLRPNLRAADIWRAIFIQCSFHKTDFSRANLYLAEFQECDLTGADLSMAYLKGVLFRGCMLAASIWRRANAKNSLFVNCDMTLALA